MNSTSLIRKISKFPTTINWNVCRKRGIAELMATLIKESWGLIETAEQTEDKDIKKTFFTFASYKYEAMCGLYNDIDD